MAKKKEQSFEEYYREKNGGDIFETKKSQSKSTESTNSYTKKDDSAVSFKDYYRAQNGGDIFNTRSNTQTKYTPQQYSTAIQQKFGNVNTTKYGSLSGNKPYQGTNNSKFSSRVGIPRESKVNTTVYGSLKTDKKDKTNKINLGGGEFDTKRNLNSLYNLPDMSVQEFKNQYGDRPINTKFASRIDKKALESAVEADRYSGLTEEERKKAIKEEYESIPERGLPERYVNWFTRFNAGSVLPKDYPNYDEEYARKQELAPEYEKIRQEEAYNSLLDMGMTKDEIAALGKNMLLQSDIDQLVSEGYSEEEILKIADDVVAKNDAARSKLYDLTAGKGKPAPGELTYDDYMHLLESYEIPQVVEDAKEHPVLDTFYTFAANPIESGMNVLNNGYNYLTGKPLRHYQSGTELIRDTVNSEIQNPLGRWAYGQAVSAGDNLVAQGLGLAIGGGGGKFANSTIQGLEKADAVMNEAIDKGLTPNKIFLQGLASGVTTALSELSPMEGLLNIAENGLTKFEAKAILKNMFTQGKKEGLEEITEEALDWAADFLIAGGKNDFKTRYNDYIAQGDTEGQAIGHVILDKTLDLLNSGFGGFLMGFGMGGGASVYGYLQNGASNPTVQTNLVDVKTTPNALNTLVESVKNIKTETLSTEETERVAKAVELANKPTNEITKEDIVDMSNVVQEHGDMQDVQKINYQANYEADTKQLRETGQIEKNVYESQIERAARQQVQKNEVGQYKRDVRNIERLSADFGSEAASKNFVENYKGQDVSQYAYASFLAYNAGQTGQSFDTFLKNSATANFFMENGVVSEAYLKTIFYNGQNAVVEGKGDTTLKKNENLGKVTGYTGELGNVQEALAKKLNAEVHNEATETHYRGNLEVALSKLNFSGTADNVYQTMIHEAFEYAAAYNPEGMEKAAKTIVDMIVKRSGEESFVKAVEAYREAYRNAANDKDATPSMKAEANKTIGEAKDEFINDAISYFFSTEEGINDFVEYLFSDNDISQEEKISTIQTIKDWIDNLIQTIKDYLSGHSTRQLGYKYVERLKLTQEELEKTRRMLIGVLDEAREKHEAMLSEQFEEKAEDADIRYSIDVPFIDSFEEIDNQVKLDESDLQKLVSQIDDLNSDVSQKAVNDIAAQIKKQYNSTIDTKRLAGDIMSVFKYLKSTGKMSMEDVMFVMSDIAKPVLEQMETADETQRKLYKDFVDKVKTYKISLDAGQTQEVANAYGSYYNFMNAMRGKISLSKGGTPLDNIWTEICDISGGALSYGTNPNDQPLALAEYINSLNPTSQALEGQDLDSAATDLALEIFRQFYVYQSMADAAAKVKGELTKRANKTKEAYKQRYNEAIKEVEREKAMNIKRLSEEIDSLTAEQQEAIRTGNSVNQAMIENIRNDYKRRLDRLRAESNEKIARAKAQYQNSWINKNIRRQTSELKHRLLREVKALQNMIAHPAEGASKHVPVNLINPTIAMLEAINLDNGGRNKAIADRLKKMAEVYESFKNDPNYSFDYDERIASDIEELQEMFARRSYADLSVTELQRVLEIVNALKTQIKNANNLIKQDKLADAKAAAEEAMNQVNGSRRHDNAAMNALNAYGNLHLNAYRLFRKLAGYRDGALMDIYNDLDEGSRREMQIQKDLGQIFQDVLEGQKNQKEVKKFISTKDEDLVDIGITDKNGKPIKITRAMRMSLIMHSMNSGNMRHVLGSGITIPNMYYFSKGKLDEAYAKGTNYRFVDYAELLDAIQRNDQNKVAELTTKAQERVEALKKDLSAWEKKFLKDAEKMFHDETGKLINETSMKLKGYAIARVKNYFPIRTDRHFTKQEWAGLVQDASLEGMGMLKERVISSKPILLEDITNVIQRQIRNVSKYAGLAVPVRNFETVMKQTTRDQNDGQLHNLYETIDSVWGSSDTKWLQNLMKDIQGGRHEEKTFLSELRGKFAGATLALNTSVAFSQAASFPTAGAVLGWKPLTKAVKDFGKGFVTQKGIEELEKINPLLWYRSQGYATQDLADAKNAKLPAGVQKFTKWIEFMDTGTVRTLEYASMYYVDDHYKNLKKGSEEYWQKVSEIFSKVVEETQPNYSTLHRADVLRNPNSLLKVLLMFKTQALQNFGIVYDAAGELNAAIQSNDKQWKKEATDHFANAVSSQATALVMFSGIKILAQLMYHRPWKFRDEDDKWSWEKFLKLLGWQMGSTISGSFLIGSELYDLVKAIATKERYYGVDVSTMSMITDVGNTIYQLSLKADKLKDADTTAEKDKATRDIVEQIYNMVNTLGQFAGVPVNNIKNLISSMFFYTTDIINSIENGELEISNDSDLIKYYTNADIPTQYERIYDAFTSMDSEEYDKLVQELIDKEVKNGLTEEEASEKVKENVLDNITKLMKAEYLEGNISEEEMTDFLVEEKGKTEDDAFFQMRTWETGSDSDYYTVKDLISTAADDPTPENRKAVIDEVKLLVEHGKQKDNILKTLANEYKSEYIELYNQGKAADLNAILRAALVAAGYTDEEAKKKLEKWLQ